MNQKKLAILIVLILAIIVVILCTTKMSSKNEGDNNDSIDDIINEEGQTQEEKEIILSMKEESGFTGDENIYIVGEEYDGRQTLVVNPKIEFNVVLAGILKSDKPQISEISDIVKDAPKNTGIWVSEKSRENFLEMLSDEVESKYGINEDGYLIVEDDTNKNDNDKVFQNIINGQELIIVDISGSCYIVDEVTGEVVLHQFEDMDPYQTYEVFGLDNSTIYILTSNSNEVLGNNDIVTDLVESLKN